MKTKPAEAFVMLLLSILFILVSDAGRPETKVISWCAADLDDDLDEELLVITGSHGDLALDTGEAYGEDLKVYSEFELVDGKPVMKGEPDYTFDLSGIKPLKVQAGDINGDGVREIAVCVYKTAEFHPVLAKRPFFYDLKGGELEPVWLGSRLARPFEDYRLFDADRDGVDEIVSIELSEDRKRLIAVYDWKGFGFEVKTVSGELEGGVSFTEDNHRGRQELFVSMGGVNYRLRFDEGEIGFGQP